MKAQSSIDNASDVLYGRIKPYIPKHKPRKMINATFIVAFWFPCWRPNYAYGDTWFSYEVGTSYYKIYNPQKFKFRTSELINFLCQWHSVNEDVEPVNFRVVSS